MADTPNGETVVVEEPKNNATPPATPPTEEKKPDTGEMERLRKEAENATLRANQLANQLKAKEDAEAEAKSKQLEEQNEYKTLYEQTQAKLQETEAAQAKAEKDTALKAESDKLFAGYPEQVKTLADEAGMNLTDTDEEAVAAFKAKLEKISGLVATPKVTANNPGTSSPKSDMSPQVLHDTLNDPAKFEEYIKKNFKGMASMTRKVE